jgi:hypothetical protein
MKRMKIVVMGLALIMILSVAGMGLTPSEAVLKTNKTTNGIVATSGAGWDVFKLEPFANDGIFKGKHFTTFENSTTEQRLAEQTQNNWTEYVPPIESKVTETNSEPAISVEEFVANLGRMGGKNE